MAINITYSAQTISPAYNPVEFYFSGNNATRLGYRYIVEIFDANTNVRISKQKVVPQSNGQGKIDISRILSNNVTVSFNPTVNTVSNASNSYLNYRISIGEEYVPDVWIYTGITSYTPAGGLIPLARLNSNTANTFLNGDDIFITCSQPFPIAGFHHVLSAISATSTAIDYIYLNSFTATTSGTCQYADTRKLVTTGINQTITGFTVFNGIRSVPDFISYSGANYTIDTFNTSKQFLTNLPNNFYAAITQDIKLNAYLNKVSGQTYALRINDSLGGVYNSPYTYNGNGKEVIQFNAGFNAMNLTNSANIDWYDIFLINVNGNIQLSKKYRIYLDKRCQINDYEIAFQDRMGSIASFNFQLRSKETGTINRTQYKQQLPTTYNTYDRGTTNIFIGFDKNYELNTNWMTDEMSVYFEELLTSPYQWIKIGGTYYSCTVIETGFETERQKNKKLIRKTVTVNLSNNDSVNI